MKNINIILLLFLALSCTPLAVTFQNTSQALSDLDANLTKLERGQYARGDESTEILAAIESDLSIIVGAIKAGTGAEIIYFSDTTLKPTYEKLLVQIQSAISRKVDLNFTGGGWNILGVTNHLNAIYRLYDEMNELYSKSKGVTYSKRNKRFIFKIDSELYDTAADCNDLLVGVGPWSWYSALSKSNKLCKVPADSCPHQLDLNCFKEQLANVDLDWIKEHASQCEDQFVRIFENCRSATPILK